MTCALHPDQPSRAERRRFDRELAGMRPTPGVGRGWRLNNRGRRYPVREHGPVDVDRLDRESQAVARRLGCTCEEVARVA